MRSNSFLRKSHAWLRQTSTGAYHNTPLTSSRSLRYKRLGFLANAPSFNRSLSSTGLPSGHETNAWCTEEINGAAEESSVEPTPPKDSAVEDLEKTILKPRRIRTSTSSPGSPREGDSVQLPAGLDAEILFAPTQSQMDAGDKDALPPPEIFNEALDNLMITLHPQNQHRAMLASGPSTRPIEPTLGLYCPIEGGDYVIDNTVRELAFRTGSEVLVLDSVQLAAGEWGAFGKGASALNLPDNPLHFASPPTSSLANRTRKAKEDREDDLEEDEGSQLMFAAPTKVSFTLPKILTSAVGRNLLAPNSRKPSSPSKLDTFFESLVNMPLPAEELGESSLTVKNRPRLIYIRDFPTLAPSSSTWYPSLLAAVRQRRKKILSRISNTTSSPVTIIFGMTPSVTHPSSSGAAGFNGSNFINLLNSRPFANPSSPSQMTPAGKAENAFDWSESEVAEAAREKRLRSRLRKWAKNTSSLHDEFPSLSDSPEGDNSSKSGIVLIGGPDSQVSLPHMLNLDLSSEPSSESNSRFFRASVLVPSSRSISKEREIRIARRREINELIMRMGVGAIGGTIEATPASSEFASLDSAGAPSSDSAISGSSTSKTSTGSIWETWGNKVEVWSDVRKISDRAMGSVLASQTSFNDHEKVTLAPTIIPWSAIRSAWKSCYSMNDTKRDWMKDIMGSLVDRDDVEGEQEKVENAGTEGDKVVESLKNDPELDQHEARLLPCIVDSGSITTTFKQVHLPSHTIDSIRTIVSLPLLHPHAFQQGILKEHTMTGCLLFGPPGTGKTLAVRALAKEAGCRMLAVSPSDVMDMYVGEGEKLVRAVFALARKLSPCVVFLDEIDALFGARMSARDSGSAFAHRGIITEFMQEMDGLKSSKEDNVIVIGATNRPFDLDDAVLRRLPRRLLVDLPGEKERKGISHLLIFSSRSADLSISVEILKILLRDENLAPDLSIDALAKQTDGFSGSDLKHLCVSAALDSVKEHMQLPWVSRHNVTAISVTTKRSVPLDAVQSTPQTDLLPDLPAPLDISPTIPSDELVAPTEAQGVRTQEILPTPTQEPVLESTAETLHATPGIVEKTRTLHLHNFTQALKEITPSSSEALGSLADLRKWNDEFGEGRRDKKKHQVWGKGRFGFINNHLDKPGDSRVSKE
ncbi:Spastin [Psilocybe cubensis]|uniref:Spastin n=1 Tax=Psilocybe cubensis TaxID=181762 RepID=A0ACB8H986_PSICU|nr:Spastin [Psilocybe cubensis]KAH9484217.1 Spastin [Psilocybe cubensis]